MGKNSLSRAASAGSIVMAALLLLFGADVAQAQEGAVAGQVVRASNGQPVSGAQVIVQGTNLGTLTDDQGSYRLTGVPAGRQVIQIRVIGFQRVSRAVQVQAGQAVTADFELTVSAVSLEEIVVTQTGEERRSELTTNITTVNVDQTVDNVQPVNFEGMLQGQSPGTVITNTSGSVGTGSNFNIRGASSISLNNRPIIYIDGVRVTGGTGDQGYSNFFTGGQTTSRLSDLNPRNIESVQILKGPAATTLYGSDAAAGVVRITTKSGQGTPTWTVSSQVGGNWDPTHWPSVTYNPAVTAEGDPLDPLVPLSFAKDTLYQMNLLEGEAPGVDDPWRTGFEHSHSIRTQGGFAEGDVGYYIATEYANREGNLETNFVRSWNPRANFSFSAEDLSIQVSNGYTGRTTVLPQNDNNGRGFIGNSLLGLGFYAPFERADPNAGGEPVETCALAFELARAGAGSLADLSEDNCSDPFLARNFEQAALTEIREKIKRYTGSVSATYTPFDFLSARATAGYDFSSVQNREYTPVKPELFNQDEEFRGLIQKQSDTRQSVTLQTSATSTFNLTDDLVSETTVGGQFFEEQQEAIFVSGERFPAGSNTVNNSVITEADDFFVEERTLGFFAEQQFSWRNRLYLNGGLRRDENSAFGEELGGKYYPRVGLSYVLSQEEWFPTLFEQFKLRFAWGQSGKRPGTNAALALLSAGSTPFRGSELLGVSPQRPGNPTLEPERDSEWEAGADFSIIGGRLSGSVTWYRQKASNAVVDRPLAPSVGFPGQQVTNIGQMTNTGVEMSVNATAFSRPDLQWDWTFQASTNYNNIDKLENPIDVGFSGRHAEGHPFGAYYGRPVRMENGTPTAADTAQFLEGDLTPSPNFSGSVSSTLTMFERITLHALTDFKTGRHLADNTESFRCWFLGTCAQIFETGPDGELTRQARLLRTASQLRLDANSVKPADFVKLRTVSLRFRMPSRWTNWFGVNQASMTLNAHNLAEWTPYTGVSPELNTFGGGSTAGAGEFLTVPPTRRVSAQLTLQF